MSPDTPTTPDHPDTHLELTADAVKVLAHPLRSRLLSALRKGGPASATTLAAGLGTNSGATSYHLRRLESVGLVADTGEGRGRERIWRATTDSHSWVNSAFRGQGEEDARTALGWLVRDYHRQFDQEYSHWLDVADEWPAQWQDVVGMSDAWIDVTPEQAGQFGAALEALIARFRTSGGHDPRARRIHLWHFLFPLEPDDVPTVDDDNGPQATRRPGATGAPDA